MNPPATIFAPATAPGRAALAIIRVSGPQAGAAVQALTGGLPPPRRAGLRRLTHAGELLDQALVLWFPGPASATGEDCGEFHLHGGPAVVQGVLAALATLPGCRPAIAGEFTRRAFLNGRLDLTEVEGLADLLAAETAAQRRQALRQMDGALGRLYEDWRGRLLRALAHVEAVIDFADEDLPDGADAAAWAVVTTLAAEIDAHLADGQRGERLRAGLAVAIIGAPNAGKSTLLNALAQREAAIVSPLAGTTRDVIEVHLDLDGWPLILWDTAGLRAADCAIEAEGIRRARDRAAQADVTLLLLDATNTDPVSHETAALIDDRTILIASKADLAPPPPSLCDHPVLPWSAPDGAGMADILNALRARAAALLTGETPALTRLRHRDALTTCRTALAQAQSAPLPDLAAEDLRRAVHALGQITGRVDVENLLDLIFRDFCIGK